MQIALTASILALFLALGESPAAAAEKLPTSKSAQELEKANPLRPLPPTPLGHDQKLTDLAVRPEPEKVRLGRWLFFDGRLKSANGMSCAACHRPEAAWGVADKLVTVDVGGQQLKRRPQSVVNTAFSFYPEQGWDGRAASLEDVAKLIGMDGSELAKVKGYGPYFARSFGSSEITTERISSALAHYQRSLMSGNSAWDKWRRKRDAKPPSDEVQLGDQLFFGKARCAHCHVSTVLTDQKYERARRDRVPLHLVGNSFTDWRFHNTGIGYDPAKKDFADYGRALVTNRKEDRGAFKTPSLRDVALHPPYMHDGSLPTLEAVVEHYRHGGNDNPYLDPLMEPLDLSDEEAKALVAFLKSLTGEGYEDEAPKVFPE